MRLTDDLNPHDVACLLKEYLRCLPEPLICKELYSLFLQTRSKFHLMSGCTDCVTGCADCVTRCTDSVTRCTDCVTRCTDCVTRCTDSVTRCTDSVTECTDQCHAMYKSCCVLNLISLVGGLLQVCCLFLYQGWKLEVKDETLFVFCVCCSPSQTETPSSVSSTSSTR